MWRNEFATDKARVADYIFAMSKAEILAEIPKLTKEERFEIRVKLAEMDNDGWFDEDDPLTDEEKALLEARLEDMEKHPEKSIPWKEAEARMNTELDLSAVALAKAEAVVDDLREIVALVEKEERVEKKDSASRPSGRRGNWAGGRVRNFVLTIPMRPGKFAA